MRHVVVAGLLVVAGTGVAPGAAVPQAHPAEPPRVAVWSTDHDAFRRGDRVGVWFRTDADGYVTVFRVDTDGRVRVLFPRDPGDGNRVVGHNTYAVQNPYEPRDAHAFVVDDYPGVGYLFAVVSNAPFDYTRYERNAHWDYRVIADQGRITGDPFVGLADVAENLAAPTGAAYGYDIVPYFVEQRYEYPRFVCYDCHRYVAYPIWDPYRDWCGTFRLVVYDPPRLYPTRIYPATEVVLAPAAPTPRFVFLPRTPDRSPLVRVERQAEGAEPRDRGATGRDLGDAGRPHRPRVAGSSGPSAGSSVWSRTRLPREHSPPRPGAARIPRARRSSGGSPRRQQGDRTTSRPIQPPAR
jgi:hypothetical protein